MKKLDLTVESQMNGVFPLEITSPRRQSICDLVGEAIRRDLFRKLLLELPYNKSLLPEGEIEKGSLASIEYNRELPMQAGSASSYE